MEVSRLYHQKQMDRAYLQYIKLHHIDVLIQWAYEVLQRSGTLRKGNPNSCKVNKPEMRFFCFFFDYVYLKIQTRTKVKYSDGRSIFFTQ